jgi:hypothetical protein
VSKLPHRDELLIVKASDAKPRRFHLQRDIDVNGISGTGKVATGVVWPSGWVSIAWGTETPSLGFYASIDDAIAIHSHDGATKFVYDDPKESDAGVSKSRLSRQGVIRRVADNDRETVIAKVDHEKHVVYGVVLDPYIIDAHDDWVPPNDVEETAHNWLASSRKMRTEHEEDLAAVPVESYVMPYPTPEDYRKAVACEPHRIWRLKFGADYVHSGAWVLGTRILDQAAWDAIVSGELGAYSIGGFGMRREMDRVPMPDVEVLTIEAP